MADSLQRLPKLQFLSMDSCDEISLSSLYSVSSSLQNLLDIYMNCCLLITDKAIDILAKGCSKVSDLSLLVAYFLFLKCLLVARNRN
jgi:hypothetical protein